MTKKEWKKAFHRLCIIADYNTVQRPSVFGEDGNDWFPDSIDKFDVEANAKALLDDELITKWNELDSWPLKQILKVR
jgi:hypothetical protein